MKIYNIYPTNKKGILIGSAIFQSLNKKEALAKFDNIETYTSELSYILVEISITLKRDPETEIHKIIKSKKYNP